MKKIPVYISYFQGKIRALRDKKPYKSFDEFLNISMNERRALMTLAQALDTPYI